MTDDWHAWCKPEHILIWQNGYEFSIFPPVPAPTNIASFVPMVAKDPAWSNAAATPVTEEANSEPDSDTH
jgi:hypothetical protein